MQIKLNGKDFELFFGWDFLEQVNNKFGFVMDVQGVEINTRMNGYPFMEQGLQSYDPTAVVKVIQAGLSTERTQPSKDDIRDFVTEKMVQGKESYKEFVNGLLDEIKKDKMLKALAEVNQ